MNKSDKYAQRNLCLLGFALVCLRVFAGPQGQTKQHVFLICPSTAQHSAMSVFVMVDRNDPSKIMSLGLEALTGENSFGSTYDRVLAAQHDEKTPRKLLGTLDAKDFGRAELIVHEDDALHISATPRKDGALDIMCNVRIGSSQRFVIGGKEKSKRAVALKYDESSQTWAAKVEALTDSKGNRIPSAPGRTVTGVLFPVTATGIYMVAVAFDDGTGLLLLDR